MTEMGKKRFPFERRRLESFFVSSVCRRWSEKATTLTFFHDFLVKPPHRKWLRLLLFDKTTQTNRREFRERKRYEEDEKMSTLKTHGESKVGFRRLMNHVYIYTTSPLQRRETSTRVTSRSSSFLCDK